MDLLFQNPLYYLSMDDLTYFVFYIPDDIDVSNNSEALSSTRADSDSDYETLLLDSLINFHFFLETTKILYYFIFKK